MMTPPLENGLFLTDFTEKEKLFNDYFIIECKSIDTGTVIPLVIPYDTQENSTLIGDFVISEETMLNIIRSRKPNKAHGGDELSLRMIKLSDISLVTSLEIIFTV